MLADNATVEEPLAGAGGLYKTEQGTLVLKGDNIYAGGTSVQAGMVQIDRAQALGVGAFTMAGGTLETRQEMALDQAVTLQRQGEFKVANDNLSLNGQVSGAGGVYKTGAGVLALSNDANTYMGGTRVAEGTLQGTTASIRDDIGVAAGAHVNLTMQGAKETYTGDIVGLGGTTGTVLKQGEGDLTLVGNWQSLSGNGNYA